jgi:hypothetical protein
MEILVRAVLAGVRIDFRRDGGAGVQTLYYVQANVADEALKSNDGLLKWAAGFGVGNVYLKAASYLPHEPYFSRIRSFLLSQGASVLQDDSGIPFRFFWNGSWRCWFFGTYSGTLDIFAKYYQSDLQTAFAAPGAAAPLPFGTGYKWRLGESNLLLATAAAPRRLFLRGVALVLNREHVERVSPGMHEPKGGSGGKFAFSRGPGQTGAEFPAIEEDGKGVAFTCLDALAGDNQPQHRQSAAEDRTFFEAAATGAGAKTGNCSSAAMRSLLPTYCYRKNARRKSGSRNPVPRPRRTMIRSREGEI